MKKVGKTIKPKNHVAVDLATPKYRQRVVENKKKKKDKYSKKRIHEYED